MSDKNLGENFYPKLVRVSNQLGINPEDLLAVMASESGISASQQGHAANASGLIQFMPQTLKSLGFGGSPEEFRNLTGEHQLDYVKKFLSGKSVKTPGQLYVAIFLPAALKLPDVSKGDNSARIAEENPEIVVDNGKRYSKKYYDIGLKISPKTERSWYKGNPLFHSSTPGAITLGDMENQVQKIKKGNASYYAALRDMKTKTNYKPKSSIPQPIKSTPEIHDDWYDQLLASIANADIGITKNIIKIEIKSKNDVDNIEFSRILTSTLDNELLSKSSIHKGKNCVEIECNIDGPSEICYESIKKLTSCVQDVFNKFIKNSSIKTNIIFNSKSKYNLLSLSEAEINYRKFLLKIAGKINE